MYYFSPLAGTMLRAPYSCTDAVSATTRLSVWRRGLVNWLTTPDT